MSCEEQMITPMPRFCTKYPCVLQPIKPILVANDKGFMTCPLCKASYGEKRKRKVKKKKEINQKLGNIIAEFMATAYPGLGNDNNWAKGASDGWDYCVDNVVNMLVTAIKVDITVYHKNFCSQSSGCRCEDKNSVRSLNRILDEGWLERLLK